MLSPFEMKSEQSWNSFVKTSCFFWSPRFGLTAQSPYKIEVWIWAWLPLPDASRMQWISPNFLTRLPPSKLSVFLTNKVSQEIFNILELNSESKTKSWRVQTIYGIVESFLSLNPVSFRFGRDTPFKLASKHLRTVQIIRLVFWSKPDSILSKQKSMNGLSNWEFFGVSTTKQEKSETTF